MDAERLAMLSVNVDASVFEPKELLFAEVVMARRELRRVYSRFNCLAEVLTGTRPQRLTYAYSIEEYQFFRALVHLDLRRGLDRELIEYLDHRDDSIRALVELHVAHPKLGRDRMGVVFQEYFDRVLGDHDVSEFLVKSKPAVSWSEDSVGLGMRRWMEPVGSYVDLVELPFRCRAEPFMRKWCLTDQFDHERVCFSAGDDLCSDWSLRQDLLYDFFVGAGFEPVENGYSRAFEYGRALVTHFVSVQQSHVFSLGSISRGSGCELLDRDLIEAIATEQDELEGACLGLPVFKDLISPHWKVDFAYMEHRWGERDNPRISIMVRSHEDHITVSLSGWRRGEPKAQDHVRLEDGERRQLVCDLVNVRLLAESRGVRVRFYGSIEPYRYERSFLLEVAKFKGSIPLSARLWLDEKILQLGCAYETDEVEAFVARNSCKIYKDVTGRFTDLAREYGLDVEVLDEA